MKRKLLIVSAFIFILGSSKGQSVMDAHKLTQTELTGTARSMSMGGAFGALGGDITAVSINPAGIGVYKSSEVVATLNFQNVETKTHLNAAALKDKKFAVNFNNFAFVGTFPLQNDVAPLINFGFSYNRLKSFDRKYSMTGDGNNRALSDYIALRSERRNPNDLQLSSTGDNQYIWEDQDWLPVLGYNSFLISHVGNNSYKPSTERLYTANDLFVREKGSVNTYDFNAGTTFEDMLSVGLKISVTDIDYRMYSEYIEDYESNANPGTWGGYDLINDLKTEGTGWQVGLGAIFKPIHELRIGVAYHSPTWYQMTDYYGVDLYDDFTPIVNEMNLGGRVYEPGKTSSGDIWARTDYKLRTPDKWVFSLAGVLGKNAILSLDYELVDYSKTKFNKRDGGALETELVNGEIKDLVNDEIKGAYRLTSNIRIGGEYRITPQFAMRAGYSWQQSPYQNKFVDWLALNDNSENGFSDLVYTAGSVPHYVVQGNTNYITWGLGYRFTRNIYTDLAFVYKTQKADLYAFSKADKATVKENSFQGALTLGFRF